MLSWLGVLLYIQGLNFKALSWLGFMAWCFSWFCYIINRPSQTPPHASVPLALAWGGVGLAGD
jgi:hypothetical protein